MFVVFVIIVFVLLSEMDVYLDHVSFLVFLLLLPCSLKRACPQLIIRLVFILLSQPFVYYCYCDVNSNGALQIEFCSMFIRLLLLRYLKWLLSSNVSFDYSITC